MNLRETKIRMVERGLSVEVSLDQLVKFVSDAVLESLFDEGIITRADSRGS